MKCKAYQKAKQQGNQFYSTGVPCKRGHLSNRYTSTRKCIKCDGIDRKERYNTKDKIYYATRYQENKDHILKKAKEWKANNAEYVKEDNKRYYRDNKQKVAAYHKQHYTEVREFRLQKYQDWKNQTIDSVFNFYKSINLVWDDTKNNIEDKFRNYVAWKIVNELNLKIVNEHMLEARRNGFVDIYIPTLKVGVEVKLDHSSWNKAKIRNQRNKYEKVLGVGNVFFVSPKGTFQFTIDSLLSQLKSLQEKQSECSGPELS